MKKLLSFEVHKLFKNRSFYIWTFLSVAMSMIYLLCSFGFLSIQGDSNLLTPEYGVLSMIRVFSTSPMVLFVMIFICSFICNDFDNGILKNVISRGYSRGSVFTAKFIAVVFATVFMVVLNLAGVFALSSVLYKDTGEMYALLIPQIILLTLGLVAFAGIFFMLCTIFKKSTPAIIISLLAILVVPTGISMLSSALHIDFDFSTLWLGGAITNLANVQATIQTLFISGVCIIAYLVVSYIVSISVVKKMEV